MSFNSSALLVILLVLPGPARAAPDCPLERAHYVIRDEVGMSAGFHVRPGTAQIFFFVHADKGGVTQWFAPQGTRLSSTTDIAAPGWRMEGPKPLGDFAYSVTDAAGQALANFHFQAGVNAPAHILIPRLQEAMAYGFVPDSREGQSLAFLDLAGCDPK